MAAYIEREVAVKIAERYGLTNGSVLGWHTGIADCIASEIEATPTADVAPVIHARWIGSKYDPETGDYMEKCSHCGVFSREYWKPHCSECGALMDLDEQGEKQDV